MARLTPYQAFASFLSDWYLASPIWGQLAMQLGRNLTGDIAESIVLGVQEDSFIFLLGQDLHELPYEQKKAICKKQLFHILLKHPSQLYHDVYNPHLHLAIEIHAIAKMGKEEQQFFAEWNPVFSSIKNANIAKLEEVVQEVQSQNLIEKHPSLLTKAKALHRYWLSDMELSGLINQEEALRLAVKKNLQIGSEVLSEWRFLSNLIRKESSALPWQAILRMEVKRSRKRKLITTLKRPSKRYGSTPGIKAVNDARLVAIFDTSASVKEAQLQQFQREIKGIYQLGYRIMILEADVVVQRTYAFNGTFKDFKFRGGGNTAFDRAIELAETIHHADLILYFTDGKGPAPYRWRGTPLLWCIVLEQAQQTAFTHLPGKLIYLP